MSRMYSCVFEEVSVTEDQDLFEIVAPSTAAVVLHSVIITQSSDAGDAQDEQLSCIFHRGGGAGSAGTTPTPRPLSPGDSAFGGVC